MSIVKANEARGNKTLDMVINHRMHGVISRRNLIENVKKFGGFVTKGQLRNYAAESKLQAWLTKNAFSIPFGNECHPQTIAYKAKKQELKNGIFKTEYRLHEGDPDCFTVITKTEFDYFNSL